MSRISPAELCSANEPDSNPDDLPPDELSVSAIGELTPSVQQPSQTPLHPGDLVRIETAGVNLRAWMSVIGTVRRRIPRGARATVLSAPYPFGRHHWVKIRLHDAGTIGYVAARYLTLIETGFEQIELDEPGPPLDLLAPYQAGDLLITLNQLIVRAGPGTDRPAIRTVDRVSLGIALDEPTPTESGAWIPAHFRDGSGWICTRFTRLFCRESKWIEVDLKTQLLTAWHDSAVITTLPISSGKPGFRTPAGAFSIEWKVPVRRLRGVIRDETWDIPGVPWIMSFLPGGFYFHAAYWHDDFGSPVSHGCVTLSVDSAEWLYDWTPVGTPVWIHE